MQMIVNTWIVDTLEVCWGSKPVRMLYYVLYRMNIGRRIRCSLDIPRMM